MHRSPQYNYGSSRGSYLLPWKAEFWSDFALIWKRLFPTEVMLQIKSDCDWPTGLKYINDWKGGRTVRWTDAGSSLIL